MMIRPSHVLAFVSAMFAVEASQSNASVQSQQNSQSQQLTSALEEEMSEKEQIVHEARRRIGNELRD